MRDEALPQSRPSRGLLRIVLVGCGVGALFLGVVVATQVVAYWGAFPGEPDYRRGMARAKELRAERRFDEAIEIYRVLDNWIEIAACHEAASRYESALAAYDHAIDDGHWWEPYRKRAECIERHEGLAAAVGYLEQLRDEEPDQVRFHYILGTFHLFAGRNERALEPLTRAMEIPLSVSGLRFDADGWLILDEATRAKPYDAFSSASTAVEELAVCHFELGHLDEAFRTAAMGISLGQHMAHRNHYRDETYNVVTRILRARVLIAREQWDAASAELELARAGSDGGYAGWPRTINEVAEELAARR